MTECNVTNPISTNQIIEVGIRKPKCLDFKGNSLNDWIRFLSEELCCIKDLIDESIQDLVVNSGWTVIRQPRAYKRGSLIVLSGEVTGGVVESTIATLPFTPNERHIFPVAHEFTPGDLVDYQPFIKIDVDRSIKLYFTGTPPVNSTTSQKLYLDGISFFIE